MNCLKKIFTLSFLLVLTVSCSKKFDTPTFDERLIPSPSYESTFEKCSRYDRIYTGLSAVAFLNITYQSLEFRKAYIKELSRLKMLSLQEQKELIDVNIKEDSEYFTFILRVYTAKNEWNDFHKGDSIWKITLSNNRKEIIEPNTIEVLKEKPMLNFFYPDINRWVRVYLIAFKKDEHPTFMEDISSINISISSFLARTSFTWTL